MINNQESAGEGSARDKEDHEVHKEYVFEEETCEVTSKLKIKFPFDEIIQEKMRRADLSNYSHLSDLISHPSKTDTCKHGNSWSTKDPKSMGWIYSKTVRIAHSNYVPERERTIYYRKTSGNCNCKHIYDGKDDQLQIVSNGKSDTRGSARAVSFVSIRLPHRVPSKWNSNARVLQELSSKVHKQVWNERIFFDMLENLVRRLC